MLIVIRSYKYLIVNKQFNNFYKLLKTVKKCYKQLQTINSVQNPIFYNIF